MTEAAFCVRPFSDSEFYSSLANEHCAPRAVASHRQAKYLKGYLEEIGAQTIVVEPDYIDRDYLDDYTAFYATCFRRYRRRCQRLHFFATPFDKAEFKNAIVGPRDDDFRKVLADKYLGFIVARPLPRAVIGRTVLRTYERDNRRRHYPTRLKYTANLFGLKLRLKSLAFQEQDTVVAACATASLWSAFHKVSDLFGSPKPTPAAITTAATRHVVARRPLPSTGLTVQQMCTAIRDIGLEPEVFNVSRDTPLCSLLYAYLEAHLPIVLGVRIEGYEGLHAITVTGYSIRDEQHLTQEVEDASDSSPTCALRIDEFYVHDDQTGPFARMVVNPTGGYKKRVYPVIFRGPWEDCPGDLMLTFPEVVIVPAYPKIRLTFLEAFECLTPFSAILPMSPGLEWNIRLTTTNDYKARLNKERREYAASFLFEQHPRFIWHCDAAYRGIALVELLVDATDIKDSLPVYGIVWHNDTVRESTARLLEHREMREEFTSHTNESLVTLLKESLTGAAMRSSER